MANQRVRNMVQGHRPVALKPNADGANASNNNREHISGDGTVEDGLLLSPLTFDADVRRFSVRFDDLLTFSQGYSRNRWFLWSCG